MVLDVKENQQNIPADKRKLGSRSERRNWSAEIISGVRIQPGKLAYPGIGFDTDSVPDVLGLVEFSPKNLKKKIFMKNENQGVR